MGTVVYSCGCWIATSMFKNEFGIYPILGVSVCNFHLNQAQDELKILAEKVSNIDRNPK